MKGKISKKARLILSDSTATGELMSYVVRGKNGKIEVKGKSYSVKSNPAHTKKAS